jgi:IS5 family transposase
MRRCGERTANNLGCSATFRRSDEARKGKGKESKLSYTGHVLMENRHGLAVNCCVTQATGRAEPEAALAMVEQVPGWHRITLGADKGYDRKELVQEMREHQVTPHFARKPTSIIDQRTARHVGYAVSQRKRKRVEESFGWVKTVGELRKTRHRGVARVDWMFSLALAAYNLVRMRNLALVPA